MKNIFNWFALRLTERTTWDGVALVVVGLTFFLFKPIASFAAILAILYGIWTIIQSDF